MRLQKKAFDYVRENFPYYNRTQVRELGDDDDQWREESHDYTSMACSCHRLRVGTI